MNRWESEPFINLKVFRRDPEYPHVSRAEIARANRDLSRGVGSMIEVSDLLKKAERAGQRLFLDIFFPEGSEFAKMKITSDPMGDRFQRKIQAEQSASSKGSQKSIR